MKNEFEKIINSQCFGIEASNNSQPQKKDVYALQDRLGGELIQAWVALNLAQDLVDPGIMEEFRGDRVARVDHTDVVSITASIEERLSDDYPVGQVVVRDPWLRTSIIESSRAKVLGLTTTNQSDIDRQAKAAWDEIINGVYSRLLIITPTKVTLPDWYGIRNAATSIFVHATLSSPAALAINVKEGLQDSEVLFPRAIVAAFMPTHDTDGLEYVGSNVGMAPETDKTDPAWELQKGGIAGWDHGRHAGRVSPILRAALVAYAYNHEYCAAERIVDFLTTLGDSYQPPKVLR